MIALLFDFDHSLIPFLCLGFLFSLVFNCLALQWRDAQYVSTMGSRSLSGIMVFSSFLVAKLCGLNLKL